LTGACLHLSVFFEISKLSMGLGVRLFSSISHCATKHMRLGVG